MASAAPSNSTAVADCASAVAEAAVQLLPAVAEMGTAGVVYMAAASCAQHVGMVCRVSCASPVSSSLLGALCIAAGSLASAQASQVVHAAFHPRQQQQSSHKPSVPFKQQPRQGSSSASSQQSTKGTTTHSLWGLWAGSSGSTRTSSSSSNNSSGSNSSSGSDRYLGLSDGMERAQRGLADMRRRAADEVARHDWPSMSSRQAAAHVVVGLLAFKMLGGRFCNLMPSDVQKRGAFASFSLPAKGSKYATGSSRVLIKDLFHRYGCHHCGTRRGDCIADHIPTNRDVHGARWLTRSKQINSPPTTTTSAPTTTATTAATAATASTATAASTATSVATPAIEASTKSASWPAKIMPLGLLRIFRPSAGAVEGAAAGAAGAGAVARTSTAASAKQARAKPAAKPGRMPRVSSTSTSSSSRLSRSPTMKQRAPVVHRSPILRRQGSTRGTGTDTGKPGVGEGNVEDGAGGRVKRGTEGAKQGAEEAGSGAAGKGGIFGWLGLSPGQAGHGVRESQRQRLYPQCAECSGKQSAAVRNQRHTLVLHRRSGWPLPCLFGGFFIHSQLMAQGQETIDTMTGKG